MKPATVLLPLVVSCLAGCASQPASDAAAAERAIARAARSGAGVWAPGELRRAEEKMALARRWLAAGDAAPARWLAQQAEVDAELAAVKSAARAAMRTVAASKS